MKKQWIAVTLAAVCLLSACTPAVTPEDTETDTMEDTQEEITTAEQEESTVDDENAGEDESTPVTEESSKNEDETEGDKVPETFAEVTLPEDGKVKELFTSKDIWFTNHSKSGDGVKGTLSSWRSTDYVKLDGVYAIQYELSACRKAYSVVFFDAEHQFISGINTESFCTVSALVGCTPVPAGAAYARFSFYNGSTTYTTLEEPVVKLVATEEDYQALKAAYPLSGLKIACLGDSITEGDYGCEKPGNKRVHLENYPYYLAKNFGCETTNYGWCGDTSETFWNRFNEEKVDVSDADVVILILGANHGLIGSKGEYYRNIVDAVRGQLKEGATLVLCVPPYATESTRGVEGKFFLYDDILDARPIIKAMAEEYDLPVIDIFTDSPIQAETESQYQPIDGIHLNREGYEVLANFIGQQLLSILGLGE